MKKADGEKSLELSIEELTEKYLRPAVAEWVRTHDEILSMFAANNPNRSKVIRAFGPNRE